MAFDKTNTAISFVENGLFNKEKVEELKKSGNRPVLVVKANFDGNDREISLWFATDKETGQYKVTAQGNKFLTGKVNPPYEKAEYDEKNTNSTPSPVFNDDDIPF